MASKRTLKKKINLICEELFAEGVALSLYGPEAQKDNGQAMTTDRLFYSLSSRYTTITSVVYTTPSQA